MVLDFCPFGCLLSSFSAAFCRFPSFWLPFVSFFGCFLSNSVLLAAFCLLFGCLVGPAGSLCGPLNIGFEICGFGFLFGSVARNVHFGSFLFKIWKKPRTKRIFWKLLLLNLEASHETTILEASSVKFGGSLARNDHFGSFFCEIWRTPRAKPSFWKLLL